MASLNAIARGADTTGRFCAVALGLSIPVSVALDNVLLAVILLCYLATGRYHEKLTAITTNPVTLAALALFGMMVIGTSYGAAPPSEAGRYLSKYLDLLCIPAIAAFFSDARTRKLGLYALAIAIVATLVLSFARLFEWLPATALLAEDPPYLVVFKRSLTHSVLVVMGAFLFFLLALHSESRKARIAWSVLAALAVGNALFLVSGRTAYVILMALVLYAGFAWSGWKGLLSMIAAGTLATIVAFSTPGFFQERARLAIEQYRSVDPAVAAQFENSIGLRLELYRNTLAILRDHPLAGVGTGGFPAAYAEQVRDTDMIRAHNPHNEYLMIAAQTGVIGLILLLHLFARQFVVAGRLADPLETHLARGLVIAMAVGCLFNSFLLDHTEGLLYAWLTGLLCGSLSSHPSRSDSQPVARAR